jgi:hypothetical protein
MKVFFSVAFLIVSTFSFSQTGDIRLSFQDCNILTKNHPDSAYIETNRFYGNGTIHFYADSIILTYSNEWECGKYKMNIDNRLDFQEDDMRITAYNGVITYFNIIYSALLFQDNNGTVLSFALDTDWIMSEDKEYPSKRRVYTDLIDQNRHILNTIGK